MRKPRLFSQLGFDIQTNSDHKTQKINFYSVRALKRYLNEMNLIRGRVIATISKFSPQIFEMYFSFISLCPDIDECSTNQHDCHRLAKCENVKGSFKCSCPIGYTGNGKTCSGKQNGFYHQIISPLVCCNEVIKNLNKGISFKKL